MLFNRHIGLQEEGSPISLFGFGINASFCCLHFYRKIPSLKPVMFEPANLVTVLTVISSALFRMPSKPELYFQQSCTRPQGRLVWLPQEFHRNLPEQWVSWIHLNLWKESTNNNISTLVIDGESPPVSWSALPCMPF